MRKIQVGVVGCGNISGIYFKNLTHTFVNTRVYSCADLDPAAAKAAAQQWEIPRIQTLEEMLRDPEIDIILNITTPQSHYEICRQALLAGKHVYVEKPLSLSAEQGADLVRIAEEKGLMLGGAPDTFLGGGIQTCRKLIDDGFIGAPVSAAAFMMCHGHESWHPSPEFYYKKGGGPLFDMGPYYLTALVSLLGGVKEVAGMANAAFSDRTITSQPRFGTVIDVEVKTHAAALLRFGSGAVGTLITSFDVWNSTLPRIEIHGTRGSLLVPDPNTFGGPVLLSTTDGGGFREIPLTHGYTDNSRGLGVADMAQCILDGSVGKNRASGRLAGHVLEIMCGILQSDETGSAYAVKSAYTRTEPLSCGLLPGYVR